VTSDRIARDYLRRGAGRRQALDALLASGLHADVVRESQDVVELILKGALRFVGVDPPKRHDVHDVVARYIDRFPAESAWIPKSCAT
jgi:HEPN domain-containing protein